ncbi:S1/P1 nuclease [Anatilimnocola floriformis]|uniref:S1/P1 nuclease n=1 Tax=Anatilimnocola floriformis TaxID=2948575 RepID=UPI0020C270DD|nr:S1/P1 nuclease [Anatilimnocola floriformis]
MSRLMFQFVFTSLLYATPFAAQSAWAFDDNGHIAVAKVADKYLTDTARQKLQQLIDQKHIYDRSICMFADSYKHTTAGKHTRSWHYVDIPDDAADYKASRDCINKDCVVAQISEQLAILKSSNAPQAKKVMALKLLVHFVGDIHQPLHCAERNNDVGGNEVHVRFLDRQGITNLHSVWDGAILDENMQELDPEEYAAEIQTRITAQQKTDWEQITDPAAWANEGHNLAHDVAYKDIPDHSPTPFVINEAYVTAAKPVIESQIQKAGVRLAKLLNEALQ